MSERDSHDVDKPQKEIFPEQKPRRGNPAWRKGVSGNPGGRPKILGEVRELARQHTETALSTLIEVAKNPHSPAAARVSAAQALLDRGWGKPSQPVGGADDLPPIRSERELTEAELEAIAREAAHG